MTTTVITIVFCVSASFLMFLLNGSRIKALEETVYLLQEEVSNQKAIIKTQDNLISFIAYTIRSTRKDLKDLEEKLRDVIYNK